MERVTFSIPSLDDRRLAEDLENALVGLSGVAGVDVDLASRTLAVTYDPAFLDPADVRTVIEGIGYPVTRVS